MAWGPGKYDEATTAARLATGARGVILIVIGGRHGNGFAAQLDAESLLTIPQTLRWLADQIERDGPSA
jgi:hypothetical protein